MNKSRNQNAYEHSKAAATEMSYVLDRERMTRTLVERAANNIERRINSQWSRERAAVRKFLGWE